MRKALLFGVLIWLLAWLVHGWLSWTLVNVASLVGYVRYASPSKRLLVLLLIATVLMKTYAMTRQQQQLPVFLHGQGAILSGCYQVVDPQAFPLSLKVTKVSLLRPTLTQSLKQPHSWRPYDLPNRPYVLLNVYNKHAIASLQQQTSGRIESLVQLRKVRNYANPHGFDYRSWSRRQGQLARGYVKQLLSLAKAAKGCNQLITYVAPLRLAMLQRLQELTIDSAASKLWQALAIGHSQVLSNTDWQVVNRTGTTHLLIISGLHIGLLASLVLLLWKYLQPFTRLEYWHPLPLLFAWSMAFLYALLSGWGLPAQRAMIMISFVLLGGWRRIAWPLEQRLLGAALLTLLLQPVSVFQPGFWFSYLAVANLALIWRQRQRPDALGVRHWWQAHCLAQLALIMMLSPVIAAVTGGLSLVAPVINLILIPLFSLFVVPWVLIMSVFVVLIDIENWATLFTGQLLNHIWHALSWLSQRSWAYIYTSHWPLAVWLVWGITGLGLLLAGRLMLLPGLALLLVLLCTPAKPSNRLVVMDVGQGLGVWLQAGDKHLLYDLGDRFRSGFNLFDAVMLPQLQHAGVSELDRVYISHWDRDHSGGISALRHQAAMQVQEWVLPSERKVQLESVLQLEGKNVRRCETSPWHNFADMKIRQFNLRQKGLQKNNASCVVQIEYAGKRLLLTGDIERLAEQQLWRKYANELASDVMLAPHHGSKTSSSAEFLAYVKPRVSLISAGFDNRFNHPHQQVLERYWQNDVHWLNTAIHGQIEIIMHKQAWQIKYHRYD